MISYKKIEHIQSVDLFSNLDIHFARLMIRLSNQGSPELFLAAALVSHYTQAGHVCLDLSSVQGQPLVSGGNDAEIFTCPGLFDWRKKLESSHVVGRPGDFRPLILDDHYRLYLYRYRQYEEILADDLRARSEIKDVDIPILKNGLARLFPDSNGETDRQKVAAFVSLIKGLCIISGGPGTGKSTLIAKILALILEQGKTDKMRIALCAPTGKAAARLQESIQRSKETLAVKESIKEAIKAEASTIHRLLGAIAGSPYFRHNLKNQLPVDIVVIDEASMVDLALMSKLVQAIPSDAGLILLGDKGQLASVEAGAVLGDICGTDRIHGFSKAFHRKFREIAGAELHMAINDSDRPAIQDCVVQLKKSYRFGTKSGIAAVSKAVNNGDGSQALNLLKNSGFKDIVWRSLPSNHALYGILREDIIPGYRAYLEATDPLDISRLFNQFRLLCALRQGPYGVSALNRIVEHILRDEGLIDPNNRWYRGRPVLITRNDHALQLFNGDIGFILSDPSSNQELRAFFLFPDNTLRKFLPTALPEHETAYAMTVHKSQGSEFDRVLIILPDIHTPVLTRELIYTAITRAKRHVGIWGGEKAFLEGVNCRIERSSGLHDLIWTD